MGGFIGVGISAIIVGPFLGWNHAFELLHNVDIYGGIILFTGMTAYDTQMGIAQYKKGDADHLSLATNLYLDFVNLFVRIMQAYEKSKK